ncbi:MULTISPECIES: thiamine pyrophosphate-binding protein [Eubacterium]|uniref:Acetolactate synthase-1/2/3 large subunit n=1 Tax=Eubacterium ruminantium TaxID=42322 RepID=A0A1T4N5L8_9FIRM|nr:MULTISPECIES: thiamine pyrophosphate-binding protein [Eubacterium]MCR5367297.1 thiamine pyrophosphate-binding protein [Eubacterium sp.]SCW51885.1 acetolactate synthase-1/2/3 large subunit [Eubacterium ruminantium]SDM65544.1 acetolactate synthase-1/2/3 large subunit [Eubacterium ruminantium]SJZ74347.1 acetolactate synthase-1/2/3 large subunit [Eubacterium ruminantium]
MKIRLADYVADFLVSHGIKDIFSVVGGGAMHLNDAFGHHEGLHVTYNHHEQACAIAAEAYARIDNKIAAVCVTTGPGGTNAITGVACGWLDSLPMMIISGQVRYDTTARYTARFTDGEVLRAVGDQEFDITKAVGAMTKYAVMIENPLTIRYHLERAFHLATTGRPGPVWIDIPVNYQGMMIETDDLIGYQDNDSDVIEFDGENYETKKEDDAYLPPEVSVDTINEVLEAVKKAKRPVLYAGYGIRLSGGYDSFRKVIEKLNIPVVTYWNAVDLIEDDNDLYVGRAGNMGDRAGNWAIQNSDLIVAIGTRISIRQVGYNWETWARHAKVIMVDIDKAEMKKHTIHVDLPIWADAKDFLLKMDKTIESSINIHEDWNKICQSWKKDYPVVRPEQWEENGSTANVYAFIKYLSHSLPENSYTAVSNGACCVVGNQAYEIKKGSRMANNSAIASMGYGLPAAIGTCLGAGRKETICLEGDGSIMMNLQELQTIITNRLPIKIYLINNSGYHSIRITQSNLFSEHSKVGIGPESGDLSFPEFKKIAEAFGYKYFEAHSNKEMMETIDKVNGMEGPVFVEIFTDTVQRWEPKSSAKKLPDGTLVSPPLEDLAPFLPREELEKIMIVPMVDEV